MTQTRSAQEINRITSLIIESSIRIHRTVGPGILETAYFGCLCYELVSVGLMFESQKELPLVYQGQLLTYVRVAHLPVGLLLNFGALTMRQGIKRVVNNFEE